MNDRTAVPDAATRVLLLAIAARLAAERPTDRMTPSTREALALTFATRRYGYGTVRAEQAKLHLLAHAPVVAWGTTRGRYAEALREVAGGDHECRQQARVTELVQVGH
ncbi:hypothetical protein OV450_5532 [Actinobacteria bacterium OV450]|nr:hypothetical protein OV450_5532 [Actinobacteria bacterium OV450]